MRILHRDADHPWHGACEECGSFGLPWTVEVGNDEDGIYYVRLCPACVAKAAEMCHDEQESQVER